MDLDTSVYIKNLCIRVKVEGKKLRVDIIFSNFKLWRIKITNHEYLEYKNVIFVKSEKLGSRGTEITNIKGITNGRNQK